MLKALIASAGLLAALTACSTPAPTRALAEHAALGTSPATACLAETGSRLEPKAGGCAASGRSYTQGDIERTGAIDTAHAMQFDPAVTIVYH